MSRFKIFATTISGILFTTITITLSLAQSPQPTSWQTNSKPAYVPGEILVKFQPNINTLHSQYILNTIDTVRILNISTYNRIMRVQTRPGKEHEIIAKLQNRDEVIFAELNYILTTFDEPHDPYFYLQWGLNNTEQLDGKVDADIDALEAWNIETGDESIVIAILDTGVDLDHPDLEENIWVNSGEIPNNDIDDDGNGFIDDVNGWNFCNTDPNTTSTCDLPGNNNPDDNNFHGTHVTGITAAIGNNNKGITGVSWHAKIMPVKMLDAFGSGNISILAEAVNYAVAQGADIINMSLGAYNTKWPCEWATVAEAFDNAIKHDVLLVAAAGNYSQNSITCPAAYDEVIAVGATTWNDTLSNFSNYGPRLDVVAPGGNNLGGAGDIYSTIPNGEYAYKAGTSMASPYVAGLAALLWSYNPSLKHDNIRTIIEMGADDLGDVGFDTKFGYGRINAYQSLTLIDLQTSPTELNLTLDNNTSVNYNTIHLTSNAPNPVKWTAIISPSTTWLALPTSSGTISAISSPLDLTMTITTPNTYGHYMTTIVISGTNSSGIKLGLRQTKVNLTYIPIDFQILPTKIKFYFSDLTTKSLSQTIQINTTAIEPIAWTASIPSTYPWLKVEPTSGFITADSAPTEITLIATRPITYGLYETEIIIEGIDSQTQLTNRKSIQVEINYNALDHHYIPILLKH